MDIVVGTAGHIDHGKTALVKALTGTDTDRLPEEKKRGITIDLGFAEMDHNGIHFGFVDVPGHERFVKNMLAGAVGIDLVMLVIAADEGVMPQTREHFEICRLLGVGSAIVVLTKSDLAEAEMIEIVKEEALKLVEGSLIQSADIIAVSAKSGKGLEELRSSLAAASRSVRKKDKHIVARLPVDRSFTKKGFGTVITGTLASGGLVEGEELDLLPDGRTVRVRGLQTHGRAVSKANAGNRTAVNLAGIDYSEVTRGMLLAEKGVLLPTQAFDAEVEVLTGASEPLRSRQRVRVHIGSAEVLARISVLNDIGEIAAGGSGIVQFRLESPLAAVHGERFVVRRYSPQATIAGGQVLDIFPEKHRRKGFAEAIHFLKQLSGSQKDPKKLLTNFLSGAGTKGIEFAGVRARTGWTKETLLEAIAANHDEVITADGFLVLRKELDAVKLTVTRRVEAFHKREPLASGCRLESLRRSMPRSIAQPVIDAAISELTRDGQIKIEGDTVRLADREQTLSAQESQARDRLISIYRSARLEPPKLEEVLAGEAALGRLQARKVFQMLIDGREITKVTEEYYFAADAIIELQAKLSALRNGSTDAFIDVAQFKQLAGVSRKYAIPLLEYFDREKFTVRGGDKRLILK